MNVRECIENLFAGNPISADDIIDALKPHSPYDFAKDKGVPVDKINITIQRAETISRITGEGIYDVIAKIASDAGCKAK